MRPSRALRSLLAVISAAGFAAACSHAAAERVRSHTYPPNFNYIPRGELESTMWQLAERVKRLDDRMRTASLADEALSGDVVGILGEMEQISQALGPGGWPSNHSRVSQNVEKFRRDLAAARQAAAGAPPSYFLAGSVSGSCMGCHASD